MSSFDLTEPMDLVDVGLPLPAGRAHDIKAMMVDGRSPVADALAAWSRADARDFCMVRQALLKVAMNKYRPEIQYYRKDGDLFILWPRFTQHRLTFFYLRDAWATAVLLLPFEENDETKHAALEMSHDMKNCCVARFGAKRAAR